MPLASRTATGVLRRAAVRATMAPSVHNTQPWRLHLRAGRLDVYADRSRQLTVLDRGAREMTLSLGCAVMNARVSAAGSGIATSVARFPRSDRPDLVAVLTTSAEPVDAELALLDPFIELRRTNRRPFSSDEVPGSVLTLVEKAAAAEGSSLVVLHEPRQRAVAQELNRLAVEIGDLDPAFRAELRAWTTDDPHRADGEPRPDVESLDRGSTQARAESDQCLVVLCSDGDDAADWLRAGEALERVLLELTRLGFVATPLPQVTRVPSTRASLRGALGTLGYPQMVLRLGSAPATPASRRRRLVDVLVAES